jgi:phage recombination protein Bet
MSAKEMIAQPQQKSVLALYSSEDLEVIRNHVAGPDFTDSELAYCLSVARARDLDPLQKQVYFSKRKKKGADGNYSAAVTVEPTIDGFRAMAEKTGELDGYDGPYWCGADGEWHDAWLVKTPPVACKITVYRTGKTRGFTAVARYEAYMQGYDNKPNPIWAKMGETMLAKCAESLALRKAFPSVLGAFYTREEMAQADAPDRFAQLPPEATQQPKPQVISAPKAPAQTWPAPPDVITTIPLGLCKGPFKPLEEFDGVPLQNLYAPDLELIVSTIGEHRARVSEASIKRWLTAIEATATVLLRQAHEATPSIPDDADAPVHHE